MPLSPKYRLHAVQMLDQHGGKVADVDAVLTLADRIVDRGAGVVSVLLAAGALAIRHWLLPPAVVYAWKGLAEAVETSLKNIEGELPEHLDMDDVQACFFDLRKVGPYGLLGALVSMLLAFENTGIAGACGATMVARTVIQNVLNDEEAVHGQEGEETEHHPPPRRRPPGHDAPGDAPAGVGGGS